MGEASTGRQRIGSGGPYEARAGYSRAVRVGKLVFVAGTAAFQDGEPVAPGEAGAQTRHILNVIERALGEAGSAIADVVRYRVFVTDISTWPEVSAELNRVFGDVRPAGTLVEVRGLIHPALRVEIEVDAVIGDG